MDHCANVFTIPELIAHKRDGGQLSQAQIEYFIKGVTNGEVQDAQLGAMLMAIFLNDMVSSEISCLTRAMMHSGRVFNWPEKWRGRLVDKHSTGGVGDKVSLVLAPALAACGMKVPMISGRGLSHTGGTLDKLESIPGYKVSLSEPEMLRIVDEVGCMIAGQTADFVPADRRMYAIRDITGTVANTPLIVGSIMSKKASENIDALVLDIKYGAGAFMKNISEARDLASILVKCGADLGICTVAVLTNMDTPIGWAVGNALEVAEAIDTMKGRGSKDLRDLTVQLGAQLLYKTDTSSSIESAQELVNCAISSGTALARFCDMLKYQGVEPTLADQLCDINIECRKFLPRSKHSTTLNAPSSGYVSSIDAMGCADVSWRLGAGRSKAGDHIDHSVGLELLKHVGDFVNPDDAWIRVHHKTENLPSDLRSLLISSLKLTSSEVTKPANRVKEVVAK